MSSSPVSAAQSCTGDVLLQLFPSLSQADLARIALVCRSWSAPARITLYSSITFDLLSSRASELARTLRTCPNLRGAIRNLVCKATKEEPEQVDWLALLPEHSLKAFHWESTSLQSGEVLLYPAVRTAQRLVIRVIWLESEAAAEALRSSFCSPWLQSLFTDYVPERAVFRSGLKKLGIHSRAYCPELRRAVTDPHMQLERLDVDILDLRELYALMQDLCVHQRCLKHLTLMTVHGWILQTMPLVEEIINSFPQLETLVCGPVIFTEKIISHLPPTVQSLTCLTYGFTYTFAPYFLREIKNSRELKGHLPKNFTVVQLGPRARQEQSWQHNPAEKERVDQLIIACETAGVSFDIKPAGSRNDRMRGCSAFFM